MAGPIIKSVFLLSCALAVVQLGSCTDSAVGTPVSCPTRSCAASFNESACAYNVARDRRTDCKLCRCETKCEAELRADIQRQGGMGHIETRSCNPISHRYQLVQCNRTLNACQCVNEYTGVATTSYVARVNFTILPCVSYGQADSRFCPRAAPQCPASFNVSGCVFGQGRDQQGCLLCRCTGRCENARYQLAKEFARGSPILRPPAQCSAAGEYSPIQCDTYFGCHCSNNTGGNTTLSVPYYLRSALTCYAKSLPVGCNRCPQHCRFGLSNARNLTTGCLRCICNTNTAIRQIYLTFNLVNVSDATLQLLSSGNNTFPQQVSDQLAEKFNVSQTQLENTRIRINTTSGVNAVHIDLYVRGTNTVPNPRDVVSKIVQEVATSKGLPLTFASKEGALFQVAVTDAQQQLVSVASSSASPLLQLPALVILLASFLSVVLFNI